jgi:hypothetical protein
MKKTYKAVLLTALGLTVATAAHATGSETDLLLGLTDYNTDYVIDIGAFGSSGNFTTTGTANGSLGTLPTEFSSDLSSVVGAVVGSFNGGTPRQEYVTGTSTPATAARSPYQAAGSSIQSIAIGSETTASGISGENGFAYNVASATEGSAHGLISPSTPSTTSVDNELGTLLVGSSGDIITENLYQATETSSLGAPGAFSELGTFTINLDTDAWSYNGTLAVVPEPATYGLFAAAGLLIVSLRNKFSRKQA